LESWAFYFLVILENQGHHQSLAFFFSKRPNFPSTLAERSEQIYFL
jgi:hypothetical protein